MKKEDFHIGQDFYVDTENGPQAWRCTDIGSRVIVAIKLNQEDASWHNGPPYALAEIVFDEEDVETCYADPSEIPLDLN